MQQITAIQKNALIRVLIMGAVGFGFALYELLSPESGTTGTLGATLVSISTALLVLGAALLAFVQMHGWLFRLLFGLVLVDAVATAVAGYFLMAQFLVAAMVAALVVGVIAAAVGRNSRKVPA